MAGYRARKDDEPHKASVGSSFQRKLSKFNHRSSFTESLGDALTSDVAIQI